MTDRFGLAGVALLMLLENVFPPVPSELIMPLAGFAGMSFVPFPLWSTLGTVASAAGLFAAGWLLGSAYDQVSAALEVATRVVPGLVVAAWLRRLVRHRPPRGPDATRAA